MRIAIQMDPLASLNLAGDSTIALAEEAAARGAQLYHFEPQHLLRDSSGTLLATQACEMRIVAGETAEVTLGNPQSVALETMDVVLMRQDPPFDMAYLSATYLLERLPPTTRICNPPHYVRNHPEKLAIFDFPDLIPPTIVTADKAAIHDFCEHYQQIVIKPLYGYGGREIFLFHHGDANLETMLEQHQQRSHEPLMAQAYLPDVASRDVRALLIHGQLSAAIGRIPVQGSIRANMRVGGTPIQADLSARQTEICTIVADHLGKHGVSFAGLDLIGDYLTEINITSPTGIRAAQRLCEGNPAADFWDGLGL